MRVVFVDNLLFEDAEGIKRYILQPHLGLISLIACLEREGHEGILLDPKVEISRGQFHLDETLYRSIARHILSRRPDAVGFTSLGCNFICTAKTASYLRQVEPDLPILLGGPHASVLDRTILKAFPQFDVIVRNEAEDTIAQLVEALPGRAFERVPGVTFAVRGDLRSNAGEGLIADLDTLPVPAYHSYPVRELGLATLRVDAGRGCPFQCTFCSTASFFGRRYRLKSAERLRDELIFLNRTYGISDFALTHDLFTVSCKKVLAFCEAVEGLSFTWKCSARMDCVDDELLARMRAAGCRSIYYGIEAGSPRMQEISKKRLDLALFDSTLAATQKLAMSSTVSFITGYPEEAKADQAATLDLVGACFSRDEAPLNVQLHLLTPEPGTELLNEYGDQIAYDGHISDFNFPALESDDSAVIESNPQVFINHHYFPSVLPRSRHIFVTSAYQHLYGLGFPLLRYVLRFYKNRLSRLFDAMVAWQERSGQPAACTQPMIAAYFSDRFGRHHHVTGLVRYMLSAAELRRRALDGVYNPTRSAVVGGPAYEMSSRAAVVRRVPDCPMLLQAIVEDLGRLSPILLRRRYDFLLYLAPPGHDSVHNFRLSDPAAEFLDSVALARDRYSPNSFFRETGYPAPPSDFVDDLVRRGVLEIRPYVAIA